MPHSPEYAYQLPYQNTGLFPCIKIIPYSYRNQYREPEHIYGIVNQRRADRILIPFLHQNHALLYPSPHFLDQHLYVLHMQ